MPAKIWPNAYFFELLIARSITMKYFIFLLATCLVAPGLSQDPETAKKQERVWVIQDSGTDESFRGLHVISKSIVWASGTNGTVIRTTDGGKTWSVIQVPGAEGLDFRDIHAFDQNKAVIISAGAPARIYRTTDGGKTWTMTFEHPSEKAFFDAMSFRNDLDGIAMSDPIDDRVLLIATNDGGQSWTELNPANRPKVIPGEGGFAASGTNMRVIGSVDKPRILIALGAAKEGQRFNESRIVWTDDWPRELGQTEPRNTMQWNVAKVPIQRSPSGGIFSMCFQSPAKGAVVGGDYLQPDDTTSTGAYSTDGGKTWLASKSGPTGYRSGLATRGALQQNQLIAVGTNGTDLSLDGGIQWTKISNEGFNSIQFTPEGADGWAVGGKGRVAKWNW